MRVLAHCDPWFLEEMLVERVRALKRSDALAPVLVIVPTGRLAAHVRRRLAQRVGALLQVEVLHHRGVALRILESRPGTPRQPASRLLLETLLEGVLREQPANPVARYVAERPGALGSLMATIRDLREAGVTPAELEEACRSRSEAALAGIYGAYHERLEDGVKPGLMDDASFVKAALAEAPRFARRYVEIVHHGAYELIGIHLELVRALDRQTPVTFLVPLATAAPAYAYAERFVRRHLLCACDESAGREGVGGSLLGGRLVTLGDEKARTPPLQPGSVAFRHAQGETSEIEAAVRFAIQEVGAGCPPEEIAIIARSLAPYRGAIEASLGDAGIPFVSTLAAPLRREPAVHDLLLLLKAAAEDFPRAPTAEILGSRRLRWRRLGLGDRPPSGDLAEAWSRRAGLVGGLEAWTRELPEWAADFRLREDAA